VGSRAQASASRESHGSTRSLPELGTRLRCAREAASLSVIELARLLGVSGPYVSVLERGERRPLPPVLVRAASILGLPIVELLELAGYSTSSAEWPSTVLIELATRIEGITEDDVAAVLRLLSLRRGSGERPTTSGEAPPRA
jgi:transcriptional regulator with XRE-family HTH domain